MESGRFATILVIVVILIGALGYYGNTRITAIDNQIAVVQSKAENAELTADQAKATANEAKTAVAGLTASSQKTGDVVQLVKQATDAAATATQAANQAKQAADEAAAADKGHQHRR